MTDKLKKQLILNLPYLIFVYLFDKLCQGCLLYTSRCVYETEALG